MTDKTDPPPTVATFTHDKSCGGKENGQSIPFKTPGKDRPIVPQGLKIDSRPWIYNKSLGDDRGGRSGAGGRWTGWMIVPPFCRRMAYGTYLAPSGVFPKIGASAIAARPLLRRQGAGPFQGDGLFGIVPPIVPPDRPPDFVRIYNVLSLFFLLRGTVDDRFLI